MAQIFTGETNTIAFNSAARPVPLKPKDTSSLASLEMQVLLLNSKEQASDLGAQDIMALLLRDMENDVFLRPKA